MIKDLEVRVAALMTWTIAAATRAPAQRLLIDDKNKITGEVSPKVISISFWFAVLSQEKIVRFFYNRFKLINLYRLCHICGLQIEAMFDKNRIGVEDNIFKLRKISRTYKEFGMLFYEVWANALYNYTTIFIFFFR